MSWKRYLYQRAGRRSSTVIINKTYILINRVQRKGINIIIIIDRDWGILLLLSWSLFLQSHNFLTSKILLLFLFKMGILILFLFYCPFPLLFSIINFLICLLFVFFSLSFIFLFLLLSCLLCLLYSSAHFFLLIVFNYFSTYNLSLKVFTLL